MADKKQLSLEQIEAQTALELPDREMMTVTIVIANVLSGNEINVEVEDITVAVQVCAIVELITVQLLTVDSLTCRILEN